MLTCRICKKEVPDDKTVCDRCGYRLVSDSGEASSKSSMIIIGVLAAVIVVLLAVIAALVFRMPQDTGAPVVEHTPGIVDSVVETPPVVVDTPVVEQEGVVDSTVIEEEVEEAIRDYAEDLGGDVKMHMVFVKGDTFTMGCAPELWDDCLESERPPHRVTVGDFSIGKYEVTQKQWKAVMGANRNPSRRKGDDLPVERVGWDDAQQFIVKLNVKTGKNYRLPTEAEWEYAARGGAKSEGFKYSGGNSADEVAWYYGNSGDKPLDDGGVDSDILQRNRNRTRQVGTKEPNELGIHDMSGNVWEWVQDWHGAYTAAAKIDPTGPQSGAVRVLRGGGWASEASHSRVFYRTNGIIFRDAIGFRVVITSE